MALSNMIAEMQGVVPGYSADLARTHLREAWHDIQNMRGWSWQLGRGGFQSPPLVSAGTCTVALGGTTVTPDATAKAAWLAASNPTSLITQRQFRIAWGTIYNIVAIDNTTGVITLDRPYIDTNYGSNLGYYIYQCYYPTPVKNFQSYEAMLNVNFFIWMKIDPTQKGANDVNQADPNRQIFALPLTVIPYETDQRPGSSTLGYMMYELYPQPQAQYAFSTWYVYGGPDLVNNSDTVPSPMTEHVVKAFARVKAYEWAEANRDPKNPRGSGADYRFLMSAAEAQASSQIKQLRLLDRDRVDLWYQQLTRTVSTGIIATFNPSAGTVSTRNM